MSKNGNSEMDVETRTMIHQNPYKSFDTFKNFNRYFIHNNLNQILKLWRKK